MCSMSDDQVRTGFGEGHSGRLLRFSAKPVVLSPMRKNNNEDPRVGTLEAIDLIDEHTVIERAQASTIVISIHAVNLLIIALSLESAEYRQLLTSNINRKRPYRSCKRVAGTKHVEASCRQHLHRLVKSFKPVVECMVVGQ